jgi:hypothetical protein
MSRKCKTRPQEASSNNSQVSPNMSFQLNFTGSKQILSKKNLPSTKAKFYDLCKIYVWALRLIRKEPFEGYIYIYIYIYRYIYETGEQTNYKAVLIKKKRKKKLQSNKFTMVDLPTIQGKIQWKKCYSECY